MAWCTTAESVDLDPTELFRNFLLKDSMGYLGGSDAAGGRKASEIANVDAFNTLQRAASTLERVQ